MSTIDLRRAYADAITLDRCRFLHPAIREKVTEAYLDINTYSLGKGVRLRFAYTYRSHDVQDGLYRLGRTVLFDARGNRQGIVTRAKGGQSIHNYGLAWDIVLLEDNDRDGRFEAASWDVEADRDGDKVSDWMECVNGFKKIGAEWGGDWRFKDRPHLQFSFGMHWSEMRNKLHAGKYTTEEIDGKLYKWIMV